MAVRKTLKKTTKKPQKKVVKVIDEDTKIVEETPVLTDDDIFLGKKEEAVTKIELNYESPERIYKVTNLEIKNEPSLVTGDLIEGFIGSNNSAARKELKSGIKEVVTKDINGKELYKIEVVE